MKRILHCLGLTVIAVYFISCNADTSQQHPGSEAASPVTSSQVSCKLFVSNHVIRGENLSKSKDPADADFFTT